ncbi:hypothetical protein B0H14DRAFT_2611477 [Mycena olivaceomarginata]|nr:hypothetical protein B0H14DRAFT_2611477 [Mycena olivaceomarginata]
MATVWTAVAAMNCVSVSWIKWHTAFEPWIRENSSYGIKILTVHEHLFNYNERVRAGAIVEICAQSLASVAKFPHEMTDVERRRPMYASRKSPRKMRTLPTMPAHIRFGTVEEAVCTSTRYDVRDQLHVWDWVNPIDGSPFQLEDGMRCMIERSREA